MSYILPSAVPIAFQVGSVEDFWDFLYAASDDENKPFYDNTLMDMLWENSNGVLDQSNRLVGVVQLRQVTRVPLHGRCCSRL